MSGPTCCCCVSLDRCDRCDLLVGLEGFHLMSVARTPDVLVLDIESCDRCAGCPGCGGIAQGHGRVVVEVIDAPWAGVPARFRWFKRRWICRTTWNTVWSHIKPCLRAASDDPARFAGVRVLGVDERRVASPGPTPTGSP